MEKSGFSAFRVMKQNISLVSMSLSTCHFSRSKPDTSVNSVYRHYSRITSSTSGFLLCYMLFASDKPTVSSDLHHNQSMLIIFMPSFLPFFFFYFLQYLSPFTGYSFDQKSSLSYIQDVTTQSSLLYCQYTLSFVCHIQYLQHYVSLEREQ